MGNKQNTPKSNRGKVKNITLKKPITFNKEVIKTAKIEIDHINHGLDAKGNLKKKRRSNFTVSNVEKFIARLDGELEIPINYSKHGPTFLVRIDCPVAGSFFRREFIMIFTKDKKKVDEIYIVTLYLG